MRWRRVVTIMIYILMFLGSFSGLHIIFGKPKMAMVPDNTYVQSVAENFTKIYMTVDEKIDARAAEILAIAPEASKHLSSAPAAVQTVQLVKAAQPSFSGDKAVVYVDTWVLSKKEVEKEGKKYTEMIPRRFSVAVILQSDGKNKYFVEGLPLVRESEKISAIEKKMDINMIKVKDEAMPVISAVIPAVFANNPTAISNFLADKADIHYYNAGYTDSKITNVFVKESGKSYVIDVDVDVMDPVIQAVVSMRINMVFIQKEGKYYVQQVS